MCPWTPTLTPSLQHSQPPTHSNASRTDHMPGAATGAELWRIAAGLRHCRRAAEVRVAGAHRSRRGLPLRARPPRLLASCSARRGYCGRVRATRTQLRSSAPQRGRRQRCRASHANVPPLLASRRARPPPSLSRPPHAPQMRWRSRRARPTTPPASPRPPPSARARARGAAACTDAMSALPSTGA